MFKYASNAETLRRAALSNGIIPGVGKGWKKIAKRIVKQTSKQHPAQKNIDDILPDKKYWENISKIDNHYHKNYNMLDREFSGTVDKDYAAAQVIGDHTGVNPPITMNGTRSFHKHPGISPAPSGDDFRGLKALIDSIDSQRKPIGNKQKDLVFYNNSKARGLTSYFVKKKKEGYDGGIEYIYRRDPSNFDLNGRYKTKDGRRLSITTLKDLNDTEYEDALSKGLDPYSAKGRSALKKIYGEGLEETDPNWVKHHNNLMNNRIARTKAGRK